MKKIMFNDEYDLTQKVLDGRKTMTRRVRSSYKSKYDVGEIVAIAQSYNDIREEMKSHRYDEHIYSSFKTWSVYQEFAGNKNKMFTKSIFMPHHIKITSIHSNGLQHISYKDCEKEGIDYLDDMGYTVADKIFRTPQEAFAYLIDKISGKGTWESDPWVWIYEFKLVD
jgi:uncharacterized protein YqfB (UPF0267 family)